MDEMTPLYSLMKDYQGKKGKANHAKRKAVKKRMDEYQYQRALQQALAKIEIDEASGAAE